MVKPFKGMLQYDSICISEVSPEKECVCLYVCVYVYKLFYYKKPAPTIMEARNSKFFRVSWPAGHPGELRFSSGLSPKA